MGGLAVLCSHVLTLAGFVQSHCLPEESQPLCR